MNGMTLIAWDNHCKTYLDASEVGAGCPYMDNGGGAPHTLRKRRAFICPRCRDCFFDGDAFMAHIKEYLPQHEGAAT